MVSKEGISIDPSKIQAVKDWPVLKTVTEIKSFIGLVGYYRRFVKDFSKITTLMMKLTRKGEKYTWTEECTTAFEQLKKRQFYSSNLEDSLRNRGWSYIVIKLHLEGG